MCSFLDWFLFFLAARALVERLIKVIPPEQLTVGDEIGSGNFGVCRIADYAGPGQPVQKVVFKESKATSKELIDEVSTFDRMPSHKNVLKFLGVCWEPLGFVVPYMAGGAVEDAVKAETRAGRQSTYCFWLFLSQLWLCSIQGAEASSADSS